MDRATLVPARPTHVGPIATRMREIDQRECAAFGRSPKDALRHSLRTSIEALTALDHEGRPIAMMGVTSLGLTSSRGSIWFLGTDRVFDYALSLLELGPGVIASWLNLFETLENAVSAENAKAIRLLRRWGATFDTATVRIAEQEFVSFRFARHL